jgi:CRP/FNR family transcriptional regulator, anaerobic regulatory protein
MKFEVLEHLNKVHPLSDELNQWLFDQLELRQYPKKEVLLSAGQVSNNISFVIEGLVRLYAINTNDQETTSWFVKEGDIMISVISFFSRQPSKEYIETLEATTLASITHDQLEETYERFPEFNIVGRLLTQKYYMLSQERLYRTHHATLIERYQFLEEKYPEIIQRVKLHHIASYLGTNPTSLSRMRNKNKPSGR